MHKSAESFSPRQMRMNTIHGHMSMQLIISMACRKLVFRGIIATA